GVGRCLRDPRRRPRGDDDLLHRHDLCLAEADPPMAQPMGRAELSSSGVNERLPCSEFPRPAMAAASAGYGGRGGNPGGRRMVPEGSVLALDRYDLGAQHGGQCNLARQSRQGAHARAAAHRGKLLVEGDGFCDRAQAPRPAARYRAARRFRAPWASDIARTIGRRHGRGGRGGSRHRWRGLGARRRALAVFCRSQAHRDALLWCRSGLKRPKEQRVNFCRRHRTRGVDAGDGWAYKRGPLLGEPPWRACEGMLIEIVEKREGMRGRRPRVAICSCMYANVWRPLYWVRPRGWAWDELESLILAQ